MCPGLVQHTVACSSIHWTTWGGTFSVGGRSQCTPPLYHTLLHIFVWFNVRLSPSKNCRHKIVSTWHLLGLRRLCIYSALFGLASACYTCVCPMLLHPLVPYHRAKGLKLVMFLADGLCAVAGYSSAVKACLQHFRLCWLCSIPY